MKRENINYLVVGLFVLTLMVLFFVFLYQITGRSGPTDIYYVVYKNITGVKYGTPVLYEGYQVGQVEVIEPVREQGETKYRLSLSIQEDWPIPDDSVARIIASGLLAAITIDIREGTSSTLLEPNSEINGQEAANLFAAVNDVAADIRDLSRNSIKPLLDNLNNQINIVSKEITELTSESIRPVFDRISTQVEHSDVIAKTDRLITSLNKTSEELQKVFDDQNKENLSQFLSNMNTASTNMNELLDHIDNTRSSMDLLLSNIDKVIGDINNMVETNDEKLEQSFSDIRRTLSVISTHIDTITYHLEGSSRNMHEFTRQIKENPSVLIRSKAQEEKVD